MLLFNSDLVTSYTTAQPVSTGRIQPEIDVVGASSSPGSDKGIEDFFFCI